LAYLKSHGYEVSVISSAGPEQEAARSEGATVYTIPMERDISLVKDMLSLWKLWQLLRRIRPDITIVGTPKAGLLGGVAARLAGVPHRIYTLHGLRLETTHGWKRQLLLQCERLTCACAQHVHSVSDSLRTRIVSLGLVSEERCSVVGKGTSNGVDMDRWRRTVESESVARHLRAELGILPSAPVIGFVGRFVRDKGIAELYEAFSRLRESYPDLRLLLVGDFEAGDPVASEVCARIEDDAAVIRTGFVGDVAPYLWAMEVLALPTYREGFPGAPLEAQAASIPVVVTDATGAIDSIVDGVTGIQVPVGDVAALTAALDRLLADPKLRARMGQAGCRWVEENFQREAIWKKRLNAYSAMLPAAPRRRQSGWRFWIKRALDRSAALCGLIVLSPVFIAVSVLVWLSMGRPIVFRQQRPGRFARPFMLLKFRTMSDGRDEGGKLLPDADRLTGVGRLLRATSFDELPQLWNVLRGDISLVGPRPLLMEYLPRYSPEQARRHDVMPGITGWAQSNGRNALTWEEKFALDVWYVNNWSLGLDALILLKTGVAVLRRKGIANAGHATMPGFKGTAAANNPNRDGTSEMRR
jgi:lipopolysaccharide/colanic/teichoic acid biosynthesis glycosyltransferase